MGRPHTVCYLPCALVPAANHSIQVEVVSRAGVEVLIVFGVGMHCLPPLG